MCCIARRPAQHGIRSRAERWRPQGPPVRANLRTRILDFTGFDSSIILSFRGGTLMSTGGFPETLSQRILAGMISVGIISAGRSGA